MMSTHELKKGDRVRVTARCRVRGYSPGDKGTVMSGPMDADEGLREYSVSMDKDGPAVTAPVFGENEIEPDV
jgi:hypothetical protein